jgi:hypothetical protein
MVGNDAERFRARVALGSGLAFCWVRVGSNRARPCAARTRLLRGEGGAVGRGLARRWGSWGRASRVVAR